MSRLPRHPFGRSVLVALLAALPAAGLMLAGCPQPPTSPGVNPPNSTPGFNNTTDPTNNNARYIGAAACAACHADIGATAAMHGHANALTPIDDGPPSFNEAGTRAGVPQPPGDLSFADLAYVIGGYRINAFFVGVDGFVLTDGTSGFETGWLLDFPALGREAQFAPYLPAQAEPLPYPYDCFRCHTTGPMPQDADMPMFQDNRRGILGTWVEAGVQCEACHGPGSNHAPNFARRDLFVDPTNNTCARCHLDGDDPNVIHAVTADNGQRFINTNTQVAELRASGGHKAFTCSICHDPHASTTYDRANGIRNECSACHGDMNLARHAGVVFRRGDYEEPVTCESCHMPFTGLNGQPATADVIGMDARQGEIRGHIFRINSDSASAAADFFTADGEAVQKNADGEAAVTLDFVCLRCHNGLGNAFPLTVEGAPRVAPNLHNAAQ